LYWQSDYQAMGRTYEEAAEIAREVGEPGLLARALFDLSFVPFVTAQDVDGTERLLRMALAEAPEDDDILRAEISTYLGYLTAFYGSDPAAGIESMEKLITVHRKLGDRMLVAEHLFRLAGFKLLNGDADAARRHLRESIALLVDLRSNVVLVAQALAASSFLANHDSDHERAARLLGALSRARDEGAGAPPPIIVTHFGDPEGDARAALGDEAFERAHAEGYAMTVDQARSYVIEGATRSDG
jgi:hypothetical protein